MKSAERAAQAIKNLLSAKKRIALVEEQLMVFGLYFSTKEQLKETGLHELDYDSLLEDEKKEWEVYELNIVYSGGQFGSISEAEIEKIKEVISINEITHYGELTTGNAAHIAGDPLYIELEFYKKKKTRIKQ